MPLRVRSLVGLVPLFTAEVVHERTLERLPDFAARFHWFLANRPELARHVTTRTDANGATHHLLSVPSRERLERVLRYTFDEAEFFSPHGLRGVSRFHREHPYTLECQGQEFRVDYVPGESNTWLFGGNSNWRGPVWFPMNYLLIESLQRYAHFFGPEVTVELPTGSGQRVDLAQAARALSARLSRTFLPDAGGHRPCHGGETRYAMDPHFRELVLFYEYFHGDTGKGLGASHQTGWTALVARCLEDVARG
jgi:mannosylglycerate hydrolase MGH1-like protein